MRMFCVFCLSIYCEYMYSVIDLYCINRLHHSKDLSSDKKAEQLWPEMLRNWILQHWFCSHLVTNKNAVAYVVTCSYHYFIQLCSCTICPAVISMVLRCSYCLAGSYSKNLCVTFLCPTLSGRMASKMAPSSINFAVCKRLIARLTRGKIINRNIY